MVAREVDDDNPLDFWANGADVGGVNEVDYEPKAFKGCSLEEAAVPRLESSQISQRGARKHDVPELCGVGGSGGMKRYTLNRARVRRSSPCI